MNAILFLINEHNQFRERFAEIGDLSHRDETRERMFSSLCDDLVRHETMEQELWYPHLKQDKDLNKIIKHLLIEEEEAASLIQKLAKVDTKTEWEEKFLKLKEDVDHHATEEETKLFPKVKKYLSEKQLDEIGKEMRQFKTKVNREVLNKRAA